MNDPISTLIFDNRGLIPAIAQDATTGTVLMMAWMDREAIQATLTTGYAHYWSRSRQKLWKKGESSGHVQKLIALYTDCDQDCLLLKVEQTGPACHTNRPNCFYQQSTSKGWQTISEPVA